jgi:ubiquinone/menaquinone biosynthesis C-methylase UbiE
VIKRRNKLVCFESFYQVEGLLEKCKGTIIEKRYRALLNNIDTNNKKHLDVGCAEGYYVEAITVDHRHLNSVGLDLSLPKLLRAKKRNKNSNVDFICASWNFLPLKPKTFDLITYFHGVEHSPKPDMALREINKCLTKKGHLILCCPVSTPILIVPEMIEVSINRLLLLTLGLIFRGHLNWFVTSKLRRLLSKHFRIVHFETSIPLSSRPRGNSIWEQFKILINIMVMKPFSYIDSLFNIKFKKTDTLPPSQYSATVVLSPQISHEI